MGEIKRSQQSLHALEKATETESKQFKEHYLWLQSHMPPSFFEEVDEQQLMLITHYLMGFPMQGYVSYIQLKEVAFALILDSPDVDQRILKYFLSQGIKHYQTFLSDAPPPFPGIKTKLRIAVILFTLLEEEENLLLSKEMQQEIYQKIYQIHSAITFESFQKLLYTMNPRFLRSLSTESLTHALLLYYRTIDRDYCQYELIQNEKWKEEKTNPSSIQILFAWKNIPKYRFLYRLAKMLSRHQLAITKMNASYVQPYQKGATLIMSLYLHGAKGQAAWEEADIDDLLKELVTLKYFSDEDEIERVFVTPLLVRGNIGNLLRSMIHFIHQILVPSNINLYTLSNIEEGLCHHPELTLQITHAFELKFDPKKHNLQRFEEEKNRIFSLIQKLDTGDELSDNRRKNILKQALFFAEFTLKTNFYRHNKSAFSFRLDPKYLDTLPYNRSDFFPELPFAIFFVQGMHFISFHIRFRDLARGGLRTIFPYKIEKMSTERNFIFSECYQLAYTQQKKNKDIPEGGAKAVIFLQPHESLARESRFYKEELLSSGKVEEEVEKRLATFNEEQRLEYLYQSQRAFIHSLLTLVNCFEDGTLKAKDIVDYWRKSEYLYLGPDENMHNVIIEWIAQYSLRCGYKCGAAFISSKPHGGINHKEFGVTSLGLNTYVKEVLKFLKINPEKDPFTVKISGGPDGDVAGNQILNLYRYFPKTAKLIALRDVSGTIYDPEGLDLSYLVTLFQEGKSINHYPPKKLSEGGFLLNLSVKKEESPYVVTTLLHRKKEGELIEEWLSGSETSYLFRTHLHKVSSDIFIPAGGRPRTLNDHNITEFLDQQGVPSALAIIEGANLYLTQKARRILENLKVLIIKDSSANKGGVICSSLEVQIGLVLSPEEFLQKKLELMKEILSHIEQKSLQEAELLLKTYQQTGECLTTLSEKISEKINLFKDQLLIYLETIPLPTNFNDPLIQALFHASLPFLAREKKEEIIRKIPDLHKKAMIASFLASRLVYQKGLTWLPTIVDILPLIASDPNIVTTPLTNRKILPLAE